MPSGREETGDYGTDVSARSRLLAAHTRQLQELAARLGEGFAQAVTWHRSLASADDLDLIVTDFALTIRFLETASEALRDALALQVRISQEALDQPWTVFEVLGSGKDRWRHLVGRNRLAKLPVDARPSLAAGIELPGGGRISLPNRTDSRWFVLRRFDQRP